jgi:hypothetical protein
LATVQPTAFRFCTVCLAIPFARLSDRQKNAQIVSDRVLLRLGWPDIVFAFHDAEAIEPRMLRTRFEANRLNSGRPVTLKTVSGDGSQSRGYRKQKHPAGISL